MKKYLLILSIYALTFAQVKSQFGAGFIVGYKGIASLQFTLFLTEILAWKLINNNQKIINPPVVGQVSIGAKP